MAEKTKEKEAGEQPLFPSNMLWGTYHSTYNRVGVESVLSLSEIKYNMHLWIKYGPNVNKLWTSQKRGKYLIYCFFLQNYNGKRV